MRPDKIEAHKNPEINVGVVEIENDLGREAKTQETMLEKKRGPLDARVGVLKKMQGNLEREYKEL